MADNGWRDWFAKNHPFDWWAKDRGGEPLSNGDRLRVSTFAASAYQAGRDIADERVKQARRIPNEIIKERAQQDAQWGGAKHDDEHGCYEWVEYIQKQVSYAWQSAMKRDTLPEWRERMVKIAALAIAAMESYDRVHAARAAEGREGE